jgi:hypothetical protein
LVLSACGGDDSWNGVRNPFLGYDDVAIKDAYAVRDDGGWHVGYSQVSEEPFRFVIGSATSADLVDVTRGDAFDIPAVGGVASPDVVRAPDGRYVMTFNSHTTDEGGAATKLYYRTSDDLVTWSEAQRLHIDTLDGPEEKLIDAAIAFTDGGAFLAFKRDQTANIAYSASGSLDGPWQALGAIVPAMTENYQFLRIGGVWHMLATTIPLLHDPTLYRLDGDEQDPMAWTEWTTVGAFEIEPQGWNDGPRLDHEVANAAYLVDALEQDGYYYLVYAGSSELDSYEGRGHSSLGVARSTDLARWEPAPAR